MAKTESCFRKIIYSHENVTEFLEFKVTIWTTLYAKFKTGTFSIKINFICNIKNIYPEEVHLIRVLKQTEHRTSTSLHRS